MARNCRNTVLSNNSDLSSAKAFFLRWTLGIPQAKSLVRNWDQTCLPRRCPVQPQYGSSFPSSIFPALQYWQNTDPPTVPGLLLQKTLSTETPPHPFFNSLKAFCNLQLLHQRPTGTSADKVQLFHYNTGPKECELAASFHTTVTFKKKKSHFKTTFLPPSPWVASFNSYSSLQVSWNSWSCATN